MKKILLIFSLLMLCVSIDAQTKQHDQDKENIIRSMEGLGGYWKFSPDWYYWYFHKSYSGAHEKWRWKGLKSGWVVEFKESDSNVKSIMPRRATQLIEQKARKEIVEKERQMLEKIQDEEIARSVDRNTDLVYAKYSEYFNTLQESIENSLQYTMLTSKGKMTDQVNQVLDMQNIVTSNIAYLRKTGVGYELENIKRDQGFRDAKKDMEAISKQAYALARLAKAFYKNK